MPGTYGVEQAREAAVTLVETGDGRAFYVVRFRFGDRKTLVLQHLTSPDCWVSRREVEADMDPVDAVTGLLLGPRPLPSPIESLKADLDRERRAGWSLRKELLRQTTGRRGERRGRRDP